jgi:glycosyltransferase involved in cell wall biosynthesis
MITYGHEKFIEESINSILAQQTNFEFLIKIADDVSPDNTPAVVKRISETHPLGHRIVYERNTSNKGAMRNFGDLITSCSTPYIALCEGDDYWTDNTKLQKQINFLEAHPEYVLSCHDAIDVDINGTPVASKRLGDHEKKDCSARELRLGAYILTLTMCYRNVIKSMPEELYTSYNGDLFLTTLLGEFGMCKFQRDIKPAAYRLHPGGMWSLQSQAGRWKMSASTYISLTKYYHRIGLYDVSAHWLNFYFNRTIDVVRLYLTSGEKKEARKYEREAVGNIFNYSFKSGVSYIIRLLKLYREVKSVGVKTN